MKKIIILIICLFLVTGCFDYQELSDMSVVDAIGFDYKDNKFIVSFEVIKSTKNGDGATLSTIIVTGEDEVLANAINKAISSADKKVSLKHVKILLISKEMAKTNLNTVIDYIIRDATISTKLYSLICDNPMEIFKTKIEDNSIGEVIDDTITYNIEANSLDNIDIIASNIINKNIDIALPYIYLEDKNVIVDKITYFKGNSYVDTIDNKIYRFLTLDSNSNIFFNKGKTVLNVYKKDINYEINKNEIIINIKGFAKIKEVDKKYNLEDKNVYQDIEKEINKVILDEVNSFLKETLSNNADLLGLKDLYYKKYRKNKENIKYKVNVEVKINKNGAIYEVLNDK